MVLHDSYMVLMYRSILAFIFHRLFRLGEVTYSPHVIKAENVYFVGNQLHIYLASSKAQWGPGQQRIIIHSQSHICPVQDLCNYLAVCLAFPGALLRKQSGLLLQYPEMLKFINEVAAFCNLTPDRFKPHSICIGSMMHLHLQDFDSQVIKARGRWFSQAYRRYIRV